MKNHSFKYYIFIFLLVWMHSQKIGFAQKINTDSLLLKVKEKIELIKDYKADVAIHLDVDFIKMPDKHAKMYFKSPDKVRFTSDEFIMLPKKGIGTSIRKILKDDYLAVYAGMKKINHKSCAVIKIIPEGNISEIALSTLWIDTDNALIQKMENTTRTSGSYLIQLKYNNPEVELITEIKISFEVRNLKIPLRFIGKNSTIDKEKLKKEGTKEGYVTLKLVYFDINKGIDDSFFVEENIPFE